jgi:hypothetical protein
VERLGVCLDVLRAAGADDGTSVVRGHQDHHGVDRDGLLLAWNSRDAEHLSEPLAADRREARCARDTLHGDPGLLGSPHGRMRAACPDHGALAKDAAEPVHGRGILPPDLREYGAQEHRPVPCGGRLGMDGDSLGLPVDQGDEHARVVDQEVSAHAAGPLAARGVTDQRGDLVDFSAFLFRQRG